MRTFSVEFNPQRQVSLEGTVFDLPLPEEQPTPLEDPRPAVVICPGGGYEFLSQREIDPAASAFLAAGFNTFVLRYSILEHATGANPAVDASRAVRWVRAHADELGVDPARIAVLGFSAGGHVAGMIATSWHEEGLHEAERAEYGRLEAEGVTANAGLFDVDNRPDALVACYAVFTMDWVDGRARPHLSFGDCIRAVSATTPPTFLWTTNEDATVPPTQSLRFATALSEAGVEFEYHHFDRGAHGLSTVTPVSNHDRADLPENAGDWVGLSTRWLRATWEAR